MKNLLFFFSILFSFSAYSQVTENTKPTELKSLNKTSTNNTSTIKITSEPVHTNTESDKLIIKKYFDFRKNAGNAMKVYDKSALPAYNHELTEEQNIRELINWVYTNIDLFKVEHHEKIKEYYNTY